MREEYDLSNGVRGSHAQRYAAGATVHVNENRSVLEERSNLIELEPDVQVAFPDSGSVNAALRLLIEAAKKAVELPKAS